MLIELTIKQTEAIEALENRSATEIYFGGGVGGGKSFLGCYWVLKCALKYPGTRWLIGRSELKNLKKTTLQSFWDVCRIIGLRVNEHFRFMVQDGVIEFFNGSSVILADLFAYPSDPEFDSLGSLELTGAFIDEVAQIGEKAKNIVKARIRYKLREYDLMPKLLLTGNPSKNFVYYEFYQPSVQNTMRADRVFIQSLVTDNPHIDNSYIESLKLLDKNSRERLLYGNWEYDDSPDALIEYDKIIHCFINSAVSPGEKFITVDVARFGADSTVIGVWNGFRVKLHQYRGLNTTQVVQQVRSFQQQYGIPTANVIADEDGVGGGVVDQLSCVGFVNNSRPLGAENFNNLKSQCYFKLAELINSSALFIDCENINMKQSIIEELEQVKQFNMDKDGKRMILPKDRVKQLIGRSPDFSDAIMMRMYFTLTIRLTWAAL